MTELLPIRDAAAKVGVHPQTLRRWEAEGRISSLRTPSGQRRYRREDVEKLLTPKGAA